MVLHFEVLSWRFGEIDSIFMWPRKICRVTDELSVAGWRNLAAKGEGWEVGLGYEIVCGRIATARRNVV